MRPLTLTTPKPLITVHGKTLLEHLVLKFPKEVDELILVVGYLGEKIEKYCGTNFMGRPVTYVWQREKLGTYHALELCRPLLQEEETFLVFYSDDIVDGISIKRLLKYPLAVICQRVADPRRFGVIVVDEDDLITEIVEKPEAPTSNLAMASGIKISTAIFDYKPVPHHKNGEYYLSVAISQMAKTHKIRAIEANFWFPLATPEDIAAAEKNGLI